MLMLTFSTNIMAQLQSPSDFLPHNIGEHFTPHHMQVDYMYHVAENSPNVKIEQYGLTNQDRPLLLLYISTPENLENLDAIRRNQLRHARMAEGRPDVTLDRAVLWMSYSVHGNEAAGSESALQTVYALANPNNAQTQKWLENTVVILDPCINPDGYDRYTHWYRNNAQLKANPSLNSLEHREPWPGGRVNHYLFDLNRDWAWQTQVESRARLKKYQEWMPHIHCDFHEQGINSPYYFAPAARPYHEYITDWQADFQVEIGQNHADYFDKNNWLYFTREVFDLLYPSYGDTYPIYNGAIGMTYEQGGSGRAGRAVMMANQDTLTLMDRIMHHHTTALSTLDVTSSNAERIIKNFDKFYENNLNNPAGEYKTYIIKGNNPEGRLKSFCKLLDRNKIQYGTARGGTAINVFDYQTGKDKRITIENNDLVVSAHQAKAVLVQVLFDPDTQVEDSLTYDITAWSLPYAYGLEAYATRQKLNVKEGYQLPAYRAPAEVAEDRPYGYIVEWNSLASARFLSAVLSEGIKVRYAFEDFRIDNFSYPSGTLILTTADNRKMGDAFHETVVDLATEMEQNYSTTQSGRVEQGADFGSGNMILIETPKVALLAGEGTSVYSYGAAWYVLEQDLGYPFDALSVETLGYRDLSAYNVLIMPEGSYRLGQDELSKLSDWVRDGGRLIAIGSAVRKLEEQSGFALKKYASENNEREAQRQQNQEVMAERFESYSGQDKRSVSGYNPGSIFRLKLDQTHPLAFGLGDYYFSLKTNSLAYEPLKGAWNVGLVDGEMENAGFIGYQLKEKVKNSVSFAVEDMGRGAVIYLIDDPLFRAFWENGKLLFSNALFMAGQ